METCALAVGAACIGELKSPRFFTSDLPNFFGDLPIIDRHEPEKPSRLRLWLRGLLERLLGRKSKEARP